MATVTDDLKALHDAYVAAVNRAVASDDPERADRLAAEYGDEATQLIIERSEG